MTAGAVNRALVMGVVMGGTTMGLLDIVVVSVALPYDPPPLGVSERVSRAAESGHSPEQAYAVVQALYGWTVSGGAHTIACPNLFMPATAGLSTVTLPGLFGSHSRTYREETV